MKFTPRFLKDNLNISKISPLKELFILLVSILGGLLIIYLALGAALDILVERMPKRFEQRISNLFQIRYNLQKTPSAAEQKLQDLLDELTKDLKNKEYKFYIHIVESPEVNALALPGGHILIYSNLINQIKSENELTFVLAHELGHFVNRDHLRGLGRGLVLVFISSVFFGMDSTLTQFSQRMLTTAEFRFSRKQEVAADMFALGLLQKRYGHVGGATDFFKGIKDENKPSRFFKFFSTHPYPLERIKLIKEKIKKEGYLIKEKIPLDEIYKREAN